MNDTKRRRLNDDEETKPAPLPQPVPLQPSAVDLHSASEEWPYRPTLNTQLKALARGDKFIIVYEHYERNALQSFNIRPENIRVLEYACVTSLTSLWTPLASYWSDDYEWSTYSNCFQSTGPASASAMLVPVSCLRSFFTHVSEESIVVFTMRHLVHGHQFARKLILRPGQVLSHAEFNPIL